MQGGAMSGELDEFRLVRPLGRGGMGEVYLGHDTVLDRAVAIKLIGSRNPDAASRERFLIEARAIARLSHPNVVTIYRVGATSDGRPFLVQELIHGKSLDQVPRPMPWREVCELAVGIARGLQAAHLRGILHRDVKPGNVMLDEHGVARLLDFGLAKLSASEPQSAERPRPAWSAAAPAVGNAAAASPDAVTAPQLDVRAAAPPATSAPGRATGPDAAAEPREVPGADPAADRGVASTVPDAAAEPPHAALGPTRADAVL